ncbi:MAG: Gx transporter family protein [Gammaproteobacteria bacterium]
MNELQTTRDDYRVAWFTALAITIHVLESALPSIIPGIKLGLANIVTIIVLFRYGWHMAVWVSLLRVLIGSILIGTFLSPTFMLSFSGALASIIVINVYRLPINLSPIGISVLAAVAHITGQFYVAYLLFIPHDDLFLLLPILMTMAIIVGIVNGIISKKLLQEMMKNDDRKS